jgi:hypothetical protein
MPRKGVTTKARLDMKIDRDLKEWVQDYAKRINTSVSRLVRDYFLHLQHLEEEEKNKDTVPQI